MSILRRFTHVVLQGRIQACAIAFIIAYFPIIGSVSVLIAGLVTLRKGALEGGLVFLAATAPYLLSYFSSQPLSTEVNIALIAIVISTASNALLWLFAVILKRYFSWGFILDWAVLLGVIFIGVIHLLYPDVKDWWGTQLTGYFNRTAAIIKENQPGVEIAPMDAQTQIINSIKIYTTGLLVASVMFNALLQLLIARWWQALVFNPGELRKELLQIRLSYVAGILFVICYPLSGLGNGTAIDMLPVILLVFSMAGLSVAHAWLAEKTRLLWLVFLYVGCIGAMMTVPDGLILVTTVLSIIALFDIGINFRKRF